MTTLCHSEEPPFGDEESDALYCSVRGGHCSASDSSLRFAPLGMTGGGVGKTVGLERQNGVSRRQRWPRAAADCLYPEPGCGAVAPAALYFKRHRSEYYRLLDQVRLEGDWEAWADFFLEGVEQTSHNAVQTAQRLLALFKEDSTRIQALNRQAASALRVFDVLRERPLLNLTEASQRTGLTFATVAKGISALERLGIVREITGQRRNRVYVYKRYLDPLNEGTDPL